VDQPVARHLKIGVLGAAAQDQLTAPAELVRSRVVSKWFLAANGPLPPVMLVVVLGHVYGYALQACDACWAGECVGGLKGEVDDGED
jgi:hypothetical protein